MKIVPVVLENTPEAFTQTLTKLALLSNRLNIDLCDGLMANNLTINLQQALTEIKKLPEPVANKQWDFDLMIKDYQPVLEILNKQTDLNIKSVIIHQKYWQKPQVTEFELGVALDLDDQINPKIIKQVSTVQIMTVDLGFQGSPFQEEALTKITKLRTAGFDGQIILDGGICDRSLPTILENKGLPDILNVGSYLTRATNPAGNFKTLQSIINDHSF